MSSNPHYENSLGEDARQAREQEAEEAFDGDAAPAAPEPGESLLEEGNFDKILAERANRQPNQEVRDALEALGEANVRAVIEQGDR